MTGVAVFAALLIFSTRSRINHRTDDQAGTRIRGNVSRCLESSEKTPCLRKQAAKMIEVYPLTTVLSVIHEEESKPEAFFFYHELAHEIGAQLYRQMKSVPEVYRRCEHQDGCLHGALEEYFRQKGRSLERIDDVLSEELIAICKNDFDGGHQLYLDCIHGIGHGLLYLSNADVPIALTRCDIFMGSDQRAACYSGVYMENIVGAASLNHPSRYIRDDDPLYPCTELTPEYLPTCYEYQTMHLAIITGWDWRKVSELCLTAPTAYRDECMSFTGAAMIAIDKSVPSNQMCTVIVDPSYRNRCIVGVMGVLSGRYYGKPSYLLDYCSQQLEEDKPTCYTQMGRYLEGWNITRGERDEFCHRVPIQYVQRCIAPEE